jgi:hypothetical protein
MSDRPEPPPRTEPAAAIAEAASPAALEPSAPEPRWREVALGLAAALMLVLVLVGTAPFWAKLLPWAVAPKNNDAAIERLAEAQQRLERRIAVLEAKPAPTAPDLGKVREQLSELSDRTSDLATRLDRLDKGLQVQASNDMAARFDALEKALRAQAAAAADLAARVGKAERAGEARSAGEAAEVGLVLALLQIRGAVETGRPFSAEYDAFAALARSRPEMAAAAAPLAGPAKTGVAGRGALARRLRELAPAITSGGAEAETPAGEPGWAEAALARLRGLVTIRRVDGAAARDGAKGAVNVAESALAGGDLASGVAVLDKLSGMPAETAGPWLRMARERLVVEAALHQVEALLTARLGNPAPTPAPGSAR